MQSQPRRDTEPELALRRELYRLGLRFRIDVPIVPGTRRRRVDIVFAKARVAVLVDGCYWHGCPIHSPTGPKENAWYWAPKLARNRERDRDTDQRLTSVGWRVMRVWEHERPDEAAQRVAEVVRARSSVGSAERVWDHPS
jgi:DNA mismatch endonuclease (patch repair protein)